MTSEEMATREAMSPVKAGAVALGSAIAGMATVWILYSRYAVNHQVLLAPAVRAAQETLESEEAGKLNLYLQPEGSGPPLLLVHSINAAASAYEMSPLFRHYLGRRPVYALDLPGYGFSERSDRVYTPRLFTDAILAALRRIGEPADVVALSLSAEFAARAATLAPDAIRSLTLISPTGFRSSPQTDIAPKGADLGDVVHSLLAFPLWARPLFDLLTTRGSIRYYLNKSFVGSVPQGMVDYAYATAHQPGAEHAPLYFLSGKLFTRGVRREIYDRVTQPTLVLYDQDPYVSFEALPDFVAAHANWRAQRIHPTLGLPHFEEPDETTQALDAFWG